MNSNVTPEVAAVLALLDEKRAAWATVSAANQARFARDYASRCNNGSRPFHVPAAIEAAARLMDALAKMGVKR